MYTKYGLILSEIAKRGTRRPLTIYLGGDPPAASATGTLLRLLVAH